MSNFDNLMTVSELSGFRNLTKHSCSTEQGIRSQIRQVESGQRKPEDVGFEVVRPARSVTLVKLIDMDLEEFRQKLMAFIDANAPKNANNIP